MSTKGKNESKDNNNKRKVQDSNEKTQRVTVASNMQPPQRSTTTISPQSAPSIFAQKKPLAISPSTVHQRIFKEIKQIDETAAIITHNKIRITNNNTFSTDEEYQTSFTDKRLCKVTKRTYISFTLESSFTLSQLKHGSRYNSTNGIIEILRDNFAYLKMEKIRLPKRGKH